MNTFFQKIFFKFNYSSLFKITIHSKPYWLFCKKFLSFLFLINYFNFFFFRNEIKNLISGFSFFFKKKKSIFFNINRAPYRYKMARNQLTIQRYFFKFQFFIKIWLNVFKNLNIFFFIKILKLFNYLLNSTESNISLLKSFKIVWSTVQLKIF